MNTEEDDDVVVYAITQKGMRCVALMRELGISVDMSCRISDCVDEADARYAERRKP